ncbi:Detected protein of unknown function [Hibiscus syriacus]|uniref:Uncharacterized protein n=1 Tax=Hibiscus syriacus TaxID=106335 RepID=A0A6A3AKA4_HIBSY|nr:uncharacterized protein LOC120127883 [Hibiscus syriacus]KAE8703349.1 Detected protein of unknown function [Hibiscus syriacus]
MALLLKENPGLIDGSKAMEEIGIPEMNAAVLMSLLEESHCEEYYNEEQVNSLMESLEAEIRMANLGSCSIVGDVERNGSSEWSEMEMMPSSPSDDMNWCVDDQFEEISMDELVQFGNDFALNCYEIQSENSFSANLWQEIYDTAIYN